MRGDSGGWVAVPVAASTAFATLIPKVQSPFAKSIRGSAEGREVGGVQRRVGIDIDLDHFVKYGPYQRHNGKRMHRK